MQNNTQQRTDTNNIPQQQYQEMDAETASLLQLQDGIKCWFCGHHNSFEYTKCENCGWKLYTNTGSNQFNQETKLVNQMTQDQKQSCLIEGLIAFLGVVTKSNGSGQGYLRCEHKRCNGKYHYTEFKCPECGKATILQELRGVINGEVNNESLINMLAKYFPKYKIIKYTPTATLRHDIIASAKIDLESFARETSSIMETAATFLKSVTESPNKKNKNSEKNRNKKKSNGMPTFDFSWDNREPDDRVLDVIPDLEEDSQSMQQNQQQQPAENSSSEPNDEESSDESWLEP
jgi:hypothetical protein